MNYLESSVGKILGGPGGFDLGEIGEESSDWVPDNEDELNMRIHGVDAFRHLWRDVIAGRLFDRQLGVGGQGHLRPVPVESALVVVEFVEKVDLDGYHGDVGMEVEHFQQGSRASFPHADDK